MLSLGTLSELRGSRRFCEEVPFLLQLQIQVRQDRAVRAPEPRSSAAEKKGLQGLQIDYIYIYI